MSGGRYPGLPAERRLESTGALLREARRRAGLSQPELAKRVVVAATLLMRQAVPARVALQILGHAQLSLTLGNYSHVVPELAEDAEHAAERMSPALWGSPQ